MPQPKQAADKRRTSPIIKNTLCAMSTIPPKSRRSPTACKAVVGQPLFDHVVLQRLHLTSINAFSVTGRQRRAITAPAAIIGFSTKV